MSSRYAIYFCPEERSELACYGRHVLKRDAKGQAFSSPYGGCPDELIQTARHYSFHATFKAPFLLSANQNETTLLQSLQTFASSRQPITLDGLEPVVFHGCMALHLPVPNEHINALAADCVQHFEPFRAALTAEDLERRKPDQLTETQRHYLQRFGYPFVMSEFDFHMTLTGKLKLPEHELCKQWIVQQFNQLVSRPPVLDRVTLCWQPDRSQPFTTRADFPFA